MDKTFERAEGLLESGIKDHHDKDCYHPTISNVTAGEYNGPSHDEMPPLTTPLTSMFTNDVHVFFFNLPVVTGHA